MNTRAITMCATLVVKNFVDLLGAKISFSSLYCSLIKAGDDITLLDVDCVLKAYGLQTLAVKAHPDALAHLEFPVISHMVDSRNQEEFIVIRACENDSITFVRYGSLQTTESVANFLKRWSGITLAADLEKDIEEEDFESKSASDKLARDRYASTKFKLIDDFLAADECSKLIEASNPLMRPSMTTIDGKDHILSGYRSSYSAFLRNIDPSLKDILAERTRAIIDQGQNLLLEDLQCVSYEVTQEFKAHFDAGPGLSRRYTVLAYLNEDFEGGATYFPVLNKIVVPRRGAALLFHNIDDTGHIDLHSFHAGLPVQHGKKFACNIWVQ